MIFKIGLEDQVPFLKVIFLKAVCCQYIYIMVFIGVLKTMRENKKLRKQAYLADGTAECYKSWG